MVKNEVFGVFPPYQRLICVPKRAFFRLGGRPSAQTPPGGVKNPKNLIFSLNISIYALEDYRRKHFLEGVAADFASLRMDAKASADERAERSLWDGTAKDGLED